MIVVTNATHVAASATGLGCLESSCLVRMLTTHLLILTTAVMVRVRVLVAGIQKRRDSLAFFGSYHFPVVHYITTFLQS